MQPLRKRVRQEPVVLPIFITDSDSEDDQDPPRAVATPSRGNTANRGPTPAKVLKPFISSATNSSICVEEQPTLVEESVAAPRTVALPPCSICLDGWYYCNFKRMWRSKKIEEFPPWLAVYFWLVKKLPHKFRAIEWKDSSGFKEDKREVQSVYTFAECNARGINFNGVSTQSGISTLEY